MAGEWLKMRFNLPDEPEVIAMAQKLGCDEFDIVGRLHAFWSWAEQVSHAGSVTHVGQSWIDRRVRMPGFAQAMVDVGWLEADGENLTIPAFSNHMGQVGKQRALSANRQRLKRSREPSPSRIGHAGSVTESLPDRERLDRSTRLDWEGKISGLDPDEIRTLAATYSKTVRSVSKSSATQDRKLLAKVAMLQLAGLFSEVEMQEILERIRQRNPKRKAAYFTRCITTALKHRDLDWHEIQDTVHPPAEIMNGQAECPATDSS